MSLRKNTDRSRRQVAFSWYGLPQFGARLIRGALNRLDADCVVVGSRPSVPVRGMDEVLGHASHWVDADRRLRWDELGLDVPDLFFQSGWSYAAFTSLGKEVKARGGYVVGLSDANWRGNFRQIMIGPLAFRIRYRNHFDAMLVPGHEGLKLMRWFGMQEGRVRQGLLGADPKLFYRGPSLTKRPKVFLFVGRLIAWKDVVRLAHTFLRFSSARPDWRLHICGTGEQRHLIPRHPNIIIEDFVQPEELVLRYHGARFLILPSLVEAWGLVVHEAMLCGCGVVLSDRVGSAADLSSRENSIRFQAGNEEALLQALNIAADLDEAALRRVDESSYQEAAKFGPERFGREAAGLVELFLPKPQ